MVRWWWPGGDVTNEEITRELQIMKDIGLGGAEIQSFVIGLNPDPAPAVKERVDSFLTPQWFGHVKHAIEEGRRLGLIVDLTLGSGWPYGGPDIPPELGAKFLDVEVTPLSGPSDSPGKIPWVTLPPPRPKGSYPPTDPVDPNLEKLVAVVAVRGTLPEVEGAPSRRIVVTRSGQIDPSSAVVLTDKVNPDRTLNWKVPPGDWLLFSFIQVPTGQQVTGGAGAGTQYVLDHLSKAALQKHIDAIGEAGKKYYGEFYGKGLRAIFCDSLEVQGHNAYWTDGFLADFKRLRGYDLTPYLPLFKHPGYNDSQSNYASLPLFDAPEVGVRIRRDYWKTVSDVMIENFYQPLIDWSRENHLLARVQAHGSPTDNLKVYGHASIPETEDLYDDGNYDFLKNASSGGHLYGRNIISSETFVWWDHDYETTPQKMKVYADELLTAGINEIIEHGFPYEYMDRPEPGWHPFSSRYELGSTFSSQLNFHNPFWEYLPALNDYIARIQYISQDSRFVAPVALYSHLFDFPEGPTDVNYPLEYSLMAHGYNFDFINEDVLVNHAKIVNHQLRTPGSSYKALVFRNEKRLSLALVRKLHEFSQQGLPVVFVEAAPAGEIGFLHYVENGREIKRLVTEMLGGVSPESVATSAEKKNGTTLFVKKDTRVPELLADSLGIHPDVRFDPPQPNLYFAEFAYGSARFYFLRNHKPEPREAHVVLAGEGAPQIWDPWTGRVSSAKQYTRVPGGTALDIHFPPYGSVMVVMDGTPEELHVVRGNFSEVCELNGHLTGIARRVGAYHAALSSGKAVQFTVAEGDLPDILPLGPGWFLKAVGKDKNDKEYTREVHIADLKDWALMSELRNFSGKGHYQLDFQVDERYLKPGLQVDLDLGDVRDVAEVWINGKKASTLLLMPYRLDATPYLQAGSNHLEVVVANTLRNRMVHDGLAGDPNFIVFKRRNFYLPSGMMGPVRLVPSRAFRL
jgi:alpha-L-rhamnosidase/Glycosyl hydrolases family 2, sugar binding domain